MDPLPAYVAAVVSRIRSERPRTRAEVQRGRVDAGPRIPGIVPRLKGVTRRASPMADEVSAWWAQGQADLKSAKDLLRAGSFYAAAFFAHQAAEKALKAVHLAQLRRGHIGHGLVVLARTLKAPPTVVQACAELTPHYIQARYPDATLGTPADNYTAEAAEHFVKLAEEVITWCAKLLPP